MAHEHNDQLGKNTPDNLRPPYPSREQHAQAIMKNIGETFIDPDTGEERWWAKWETSDGQKNFYLFGDPNNPVVGYTLDVWTLESDGQYRYSFSPGNKIKYEHPHNHEQTDKSQESLHKELYEMLSGESTLHLGGRVADEFDRIVAYDEVLVTLDSLSPDERKKELSHVHPIDVLMAANALIRRAEQMRITVANEELFKEAYLEMIQQIETSINDQNANTGPIPIVYEPFKIEFKPKPISRRSIWLHQLKYLLRNI